MTSLARWYSPVVIFFLHLNADASWTGWTYRNHLPGTAGKASTSQFHAVSLIFARLLKLRRLHGLQRIRVVLSFGSTRYRFGTHYGPQSFSIFTLICRV
jgi:hypothetical protein